ncbi:Metallo-dependent phosphatase-like protein [Phlebopus sp. FC_14]|nr:Metallo-dependent phosphatase-like protein [Phlebopus sp. FC_14]
MIADHADQPQILVYKTEKEIPPHPGAGWTRFVCISDTHSRRYHVPLGDVLLHSGDLSSYGSLPQLTCTVEWLKSLAHPIKIVVAGNHDLCLDKKFGQSGWGLSPDTIRHAQAYMHSQASVGVYYLEHEPFHFTSPSGRVWKVYGSPAAPIHLEGAFQYASTTEAQAIYAQIPDDTEILITHTPPFSILDRTSKGKHAGCPVLSSRLEELKHCRLHVFGHIHESFGVNMLAGGSGVSLIFVNAAMAKSENAVVVDLRN